jgi:aminomethyltransferase
MGQLLISGDNVTAQLEKLLPADLQSLPVNGQVYSLLTNDAGGVRDDLIITRWSDERFFLVINAACKDDDIAYLQENLDGLNMEILDQQALLALQGPAAREVLVALVPEIDGLTFMSGLHAKIDGQPAYITCSGYTGEDGFEISIANQHAEALARQLLAHEKVSPIGLGARDSLRLEAGLSLYGHELNMETTPVEACLMWSIGAARREQGERAGGFPGAEAIFQLRQRGATRKRAGLIAAGKRPVRDGQIVLDDAGTEVGIITSAAYGASLGKPLALATIDVALAEPGQELTVDVRGKSVAVTVARTPFVAQRYFRG